MISYVAQKPPLAGRRGIFACACARSNTKGVRVHFAADSVTVNNEYLCGSGTACANAVKETLRTSRVGRQFTRK